MENYRKGKNIEAVLDRASISIANLPSNFLWMQVRGGSKIRNLLSHALAEFPNSEHVVWTGIGPAIAKTISCAEIMKREYGNQLHQVTKIAYNRVDEYWEPLISEMDEIVVHRKQPLIHILLSTQRLNEDDEGYQAPDAVITFEERSNNIERKVKSCKKSSSTRLVHWLNKK